MSFVLIIIVLIYVICLFNKRKLDNLHRVKLRGVKGSKADSEML